MAQQSKAFGNEMVKFKAALAALKAEPDAYKGFEEQVRALEDGITALEKLDAEQEALKAKLHEKTEELYAKIDDTDKTYAALKRMWKARFGTNTAKAKAFEPGEGAISHRNPANH